MIMVVVWLCGGGGGGSGGGVCQDDDATKTMQCKLELMLAVVLRCSLQGTQRLCEGFAKCRFGERRETGPDRVREGRRCAY